MLTENNFFQWHFFLRENTSFRDIATGTFDHWSNKYRKNCYLVLGYVLCMRTEYIVIVSLLKGDCKRFPVTDCPAFLSNLFLYFTVLAFQDILIISNLNLIFCNFTLLLFILSSDYTKMDGFSFLRLPLTSLKDYCVCFRSRYVYQL